MSDDLFSETPGAHRVLRKAGFFPYRSTGCWEKEGKRYTENEALKQVKLESTGEAKSPEEA